MRKDREKRKRRKRKTRERGKGVLELRHLPSPAGGS
jgi:hypothetical protein